MLQQKNKSYNELSKLKTFEERVNYLRCKSKIGDIKFGSNRYLNQRFYTTDKKWLKSRNAAILRDKGCDCGITDGNHDIKKHLVVHHINPITIDNIINKDSCLYDLNNLICVSDKTHKIIHYSRNELKGIHSKIMNPYNKRFRNDTCPWKIQNEE